MEKFEEVVWRIVGIILLIPTIVGAVVCFNYVYDYFSSPDKKSREEAMQQIEKFVKDKKYEKAVAAYWKMVRYEHDTEAYAALRDLADHAVKDDLDNLIKHKQEKIEKERIKLLKQKTEQYLYGPFIYPSTENGNSTIAFVGPRTDTEYKLPFIRIDGITIPCLSKELVQKEFPQSEISAYGTPGLYFINGLNPQMIIPAGKYNQLLYKEKLMAFVRLCRYYGAKRVCLTHISSLQKSRTIRTREDVAVAVGCDSEDKREDGEMYEKLFYCDFNFSGARENGNPPESPWFNNEFKEFSMQCKGENRVTQSVVVLDYTENMGLPASIISKLFIQGVDTGLKVERFGKYRCYYTVSF